MSGYVPIAQLVLHELHQVQRLVNELSSKLEKIKVAAEESGKEVATTDFSSSTLAQIESDIRQSFSSLYADISRQIARRVE
jgi:hypothetical protein